MRDTSVTDWHAGGSLDFVEFVSAVFQHLSLCIPLVSLQP